MKQIYNSLTVNIPKDVKISVNSRNVKVQGKFGKVEKAFRHVPVDMKLIKKGTKLSVGMWQGTVKKLSCIRTVCSQVQNMIAGASRKYEYKMRLVYRHFPIQAVVDTPHEVKISNFLGEKRVRKIDMMEGVTISRSAHVKDELKLEGVDKTAVARSAALIHQATLVRRKDIRQFLDGIYVSEKSNMEEEAKGAPAMTKH
eukprot:GHVU01183212.1.p1 GENE.GHVU01183212.1~~GHVU01183212.1.p1  ORF type:complete len:199 (+),score=35.43 GHVU01183212.1:82-678(+)